MPIDPKITAQIKEKFSDDKESGRRIEALLDEMANDQAMERNEILESLAKIMDYLELK